RIGLALPLPTSNSREALGFLELHLLAAEQIFGVLAFRDVHGNAQHPLGVAIGRVVELAFGTHPSNRAVRPGAAKFRRIRCPPFLCVLDGLPDQAPVFWMDRTTEVFDVSDEKAGRPAEDGGEVAEPDIAVRLEVPFPAYRPARFHGQSQPIV